MKHCWKNIQTNNNKIRDPLKTWNDRTNWRGFLQNHFLSELVIMGKKKSFKIDDERCSLYYNGEKNHMVKWWCRYLIMKCSSVSIIQKLAKNKCFDWLILIKEKKKLKTVHYKKCALKITVIFPLQTGVNIQPQ